MFSTYKVAFYTTTYRYHVKRQDIGQHVRLIIAPHIQWNFFVLERTPQLASLLRLGIGGRDRCVPLLSRSVVSWPQVRTHALSRSMLIHKKTQEFKQAWFPLLRGVAQLGFQPSCTRIPCAIDNKKDLMTSKLVSSPLLLSAPLIYDRDYCGCLPMYARIPPST